MSVKKVVIFEDELTSNFNPLVLTRPVFELLCGMKSLWENMVGRFYPTSDIAFVCRSYLKDTLQQRTCHKINDLSKTDHSLFLNGRILAAFSELPPLEGEEEIVSQNGVIAYARLESHNIANLSFSDEPKDFTDSLASINVPKKEVGNIRFAKYLWELISSNANAIDADFGFYAKPQNSEGVIEDGCYIRAKDGDSIRSYTANEAKKLMLDGKLDLYIGKGARVYPNVTVDLTGGPVYIGAYTDVRPPTLIDGPCCIMDNAGTSKKTTIIDGALIRSGSTLGPVCRVGGELEESIIQGYTNKHHAGFIGHAYLGEWVNVGAMATNSDLKNDLSDVKVPVNGKVVDTGDLKVGCFVGDHSKLGIGALLTTGTVVGIMTNVLSSGDLPPQDVPSYCFYRENKLSKGFRPKTVIETAARVMARRAVEQTPADIAMLEKVFEIIEKVRDEEIEKYNRKVDAEIIKIIKQYEKEKK